MPPANDLFIAAESLKSILVARATGDQSSTDNEYRLQRDTLMASPVAKPKLPRFVQSCRTLAQFWGFIQPMFRSYQERRQYLHEEFEPLLAMLESSSMSPGDEAATEVLGLPPISWTV